MTRPPHLLKLKLGNWYTKCYLRRNERCDFKSPLPNPHFFRLCWWCHCIRISPTHQSAEYIEVFYTALIASFQSYCKPLWQRFDTTFTKRIMATLIQPWCTKTFETLSQRFFRMCWRCHCIRISPTHQSVLYIEVLYTALVASSQSYYKTLWQRFDTTFTKRIMATLIQPWCPTTFETVTFFSNVLAVPLHPNITHPSKRSVYRGFLQHFHSFLSKLLQNVVTTFWHNVYKTYYGDSHTTLESHNFRNVLTTLWQRKIPTYQNTTLLQRYITLWQRFVLAGQRDPFRGGQIGSRS